MLYSINWLLAIICVAVTITSALPWECPADPSACIAGDRHKPFATPEDSSYAQCFDYQNSSCCTANFTQQLATSDITHITDGTSVFSWSECGGMTATCEDFFLQIECFYRCSPQMVYFEGAWPSSLDYVPICSNFCDNWFTACESDRTCVDNWIFDWALNATTGVNVCPANSTCTTFASRYTDAMGLCNTLWGSTFNYTDSANGMCLTPGDASTNAQVVQSIFAPLQCTAAPSMLPIAMPTTSAEPTSSAFPAVAFPYAGVFAMVILCYLSHNQ